MPSGKFIQTLNARTVEAEGSVVILSKDPARSPALKAIKVDDQKRISRLLPEDGLDPSGKTPVIFIFSGTLYDASPGAAGICSLVHDDGFAFGDVLFTIESLHPVFVGGICTELSVLAY